ncbi:ubiquinone biosynthesis regulatory protein kinase UbiB [Cardiobacteriales bacterium ML27]|uniref:Ubiquinone biosynthesis regulatory protein kinase UbiB n=1 Tax=Ostreibacterium oceani TaxID=2654998 RepID=A0A6N7EWF8_9GAMM|nr:ubiquinone biosynthesis regulatory protein kinase UbiB [Ostreibacterium oceani]
MQNVARFFKVWHTLAKYRIDALIPKTSRHGMIKLLVFMMPVAWFRQPSESRAVRVRLSLESLGPIYVKFGQALSTRPDLLPPDIAAELAKLQDDVAPFSKELAIEIIEKSLKTPVGEAFASFSDEVLASASIAQVHTATLHSGESVVVKVVRPQIERTIRNDLWLMYRFANVLQRLSKNIRRLHLPEVVSEFDKTIMGELDLMQEAANASTLKHNFKDSDLLYVPEIYWDYCGKNVLVMERVFAVSIGDMKTLREKRVNLKELAARGVTIFFTQVFYHQYFHADMHPGNIFVDISDPEKPKYVAIDFGIMGSLNDQDQYYLAENFLAFFNRDYRRVAKLHIDSGWVPANVSVTDFEAAIRKASEPIFGKPLKDISFAQFLLTLFQTARRFEMEVQPQLVLLQKTFFNIEGLGRVLYPDLDLWETGKPILEKWMKDRFGLRAILKQMRTHSGEYTEALTQLPLLINQQLQQTQQQQQQQERRQRAQWRRSLIVAASVVFSASAWLIFQPSLWAEPYSRYFLGGVIVLMVWQLRRGLKSEA